MSDISNPLTSIEEQYKLTAEIENFIESGLSDIRDDALPIGSSFLNLWNRVIPRINIDDHLLKEYCRDYSWRKDRD